MSLFVACANRSYLDHLAEEVNDTLQESGQVLIAELSRNFGLPLNFLVEVQAQMVYAYTHLLYTCCRTFSPGWVPLSMVSLTHWAVCCTLMLMWQGIGHAYVESSAQPPGKDTSK